MSLTLQIVRQFNPEPRNLRLIGVGLGHHGLLKVLSLLLQLQVVFNLNLGDFVPELFEGVFVVLVLAEDARVCVDPLVSRLNAVLQLLEFAFRLLLGLSDEVRLALNQACKVFQRLYFFGFDFGELRVHALDGLFELQVKVYDLLQSHFLARLDSFIELLGLFVWNAGQSRDVALFSFLNLAVGRGRRHLVENISPPQRNDRLGHADVGLIELGHFVLLVDVHVYAYFVYVCWRWAA